MPLLIALAMLVLVLVAMIVLLPIALVQRYRVGTARTRARAWLITINLVGVSLSLLFFLAGAAMSSIWIPRAFVAALAGAAVGGLLGLAGLRLTRWEHAPAASHYTPNHWLVLAITVTVTARLIYGVWRAWHAWQATGADDSWLAASGAAGSIGAGAVVLGYYLVFWFGVRRRILH